MPRTKPSYDIETLIEMLGNQLNAVYRLTDEERPLNEQLKLLDTLGKTCSRIAGLIEQQRKLEGSDPNQLSAVLGQVLKEIRSEE
ncbi:MAG: hypothetical protein AB9907_18000 [Flexilinea sp.]